MAKDVLRKVCVAGIGAIEFSREKLSDLRETVGDSLDEFVDWPLASQTGVKLGTGISRFCACLQLVSMFVETSV